MLIVMRVGIDLRPASFAARATCSRRAIIFGATDIGAGRKSRVSAKNLTTSNPMLAICAMSSRTSPMSNSRHIHIAVRRGQ